MKKIFLLFCISIFLISCTSIAPISSSYCPIVDEQATGFSHNKYQQDLQQCRAYAKNAFSDQHSKDAIQIALTTNAFGKFLADLPGPDTDPDLEGNQIIEKQKRIIRNCMRGRGYKVLD